MNELVWFYFTIIINIVIGFATYYASKRDRNKHVDEYKKRQEKEIERVRKKFNLWFFRGLYLERNIMNELERTALNEVLRTVRLINQKVAEVVELQSQQELAITYLRGIMDGSLSDWLSLELVE